MSIKRIHFVGIGGIGMSGIAQLCLEKSYIVSGSDIKESENTNQLKELGVDVCIGHHPDNVKNKELVVYSSAIKADNPELKEAAKQRIVVFKRAEFLATLMDKQTVIAITGAHGKTTTSSLVAHLLTDAKLSPTIAVGGIVTNISNNAKLGRGRYFVAEADESDGTFLLYKYRYSIITNIDREHIDYYKTFANVKKAFRKFILNAQTDGCIFWCFDDKDIRKLIKHTDKRNISFGLNKKADIYATNIKFDIFDSQFDVFFKDRFIERFKLSIPARHNISNSLAVIALGLELGIDKDLIKRALSSFLGVKRRFQVRYNHNDVLIIDDYAHHPTEISATLNAAKGLNKKRILVVFQPHRYSRLKYLLREFSRSFFDADHLFITDIYPAGEKRISGINAKNLYKSMKKFSRPKTRFLDKGILAKEILGFIKRGDALLFLGAGDINKVCDEVIREFERKNKI